MRIAPLKEDWHIGCTIKSFCDWKYMLLGIDPREFQDRYHNISWKIRSIYNIYDNLQKNLEDYDRTF